MSKCEKKTGSIFAPLKSQTQQIRSSHARLPECIFASQFSHTICSRREPSAIDLPACVCVRVYVMIMTRCVGFHVRQQPRLLTSLLPILPPPCARVCVVFIFPDVRNTSSSRVVLCCALVSASDPCATSNSLSPFARKPKLDSFPHRHASARRRECERDTKQKQQKETKHANKTKQTKKKNLQRIWRQTNGAPGR